jgi:plasmid maintenance system antidote protein VapI
MSKDKLIKIGIKDRKELREILDCTQSMANKIWYKQSGLSMEMARRIKEKTGASLDYLLS